jgi:hypothetical protein
MGAAEFGMVSQHTARSERVAAATAALSRRDQPGRRRRRKQRGLRQCRIRKGQAGKKRDGRKDIRRYSHDGAFSA